MQLDSQFINFINQFHTSLISMMRRLWNILIFLFFCSFAMLQAAGEADSLLRELGCGNCHNGVISTVAMEVKAPNLSFAGAKYPSAYLFSYLQKPVRVRHNIGATRMPNFAFDVRESLALTLFLSELRELPESVSLRGKAKGAAHTSPEIHEIITRELQCTKCHIVAGEGSNRTTDLATVGYRLQRDWLTLYLLNPAPFEDTDAGMPRFFFDAEAEDASVHGLISDAEEMAASIVDYLSAMGRSELQELEVRFSAARQTYPDVTAEMGRRILLSQNCLACHRLDGVEPWFERNGPDLSIESQRVQPRWLRNYFSETHAVRPFGYFPGSGSRMPDFNLTEREVEILTEHFFGSNRGTNQRESERLSSYAMRKTESLLREKLSCLGCHRLGDEGGHIGPDLGSVSQRLNGPFVDMMIQHPREIVPASIMPKSALQPKRAILIGNFLKQANVETTPPAYLSLIDHTPFNPKMKGTGSLYREYCSVCHGLDGSGNGYNAQYMPAAPVSHSDVSLMSQRADDTLYDGINGGGVILGKHHFMPPWGETLSPHEIRNLVAEIRRLCRCEGPAWSR